MTELTHISLFNYNSLPSREAQELRDSAYEVRGLIKRTIQDIMIIGARLMRAKEMLGSHEDFSAWLQLEFKMTYQTAMNFMRVHERFGDLHDGAFKKFLNLPVSALYELAAPSTPDSVVVEVGNRLDAGERVKISEIAALKAEAKAAHERADAEARRAEAAEGRAGELDLRLSEADAAKSAAVEAAKDEGRKEARADLGKAMAEAERKREAEKAALAEKLAKAEAQAAKAAAALAADHAEAEARAKELADLHMAQAQKAAQGITAGAEKEARAVMAAAEAKAAAAEKRAEQAKTHAEHAQWLCDQHKEELKRLGSREAEAQSIMKVCEDFASEIFMFLAAIRDLDRDHSADPRLTKWFATIAQGVDGLAPFLRSEAGRLPIEGEIIDSPSSSHLRVV